MAAGPDSLRRARPLLGTFVEVAVFAAGPHGHAAIEAAFAAAAKVHRLMSFHDPDSDISRLNREASARAVTVDPWTFEVLQMAVELHGRSNGAFDVAVAPALQELGLLPRHEDRTSPHRSRCDALELRPPCAARFRDPCVRIDLGGIAKGFAVDRAVEVLRQSGVAGGLVNAGGDLAAFGPRSHAIHLRDPRNGRIVMGEVAVTDGALASSGGGLDPFLSWEVAAPRILDPRTGRPPRSVVGATVRAPSCMVADALSKIVMIEGESADALLTHFQAAALLVSADGISASRGWHDACSLAA
jgi:thiamine biosynthesis lipoprotein